MTDDVVIVIPADVRAAGLCLTDAARAWLARHCWGMVDLRAGRITDAALMGTDALGAQVAAAARARVERGRG